MINLSKNVWHILLSISLGTHMRVPTRKIEILKPYFNGNDDWWRQLIFISIDMTEVMNSDVGENV